MISQTPLPTAGGFVVCSVACFTVCPFYGLLSFVYPVVPAFELVDLLMSYCFWKRFVLTVRLWFSLRSGLIAGVLLCLASSFTLADQTELQNANSSFEQKGGWLSNLADFATIQSIQQRGWYAGEATGRETDMGQRFMRITGAGDVAQYVTVNQQSGYQILSVLAFREAAGGRYPGQSLFGITYYDAGFNEIVTIQEGITTRSDSNRGHGDGMVPHSLGLLVPPQARYACIWVWNPDDTTATYIDKFELVNYFTESNYVFDPRRATGDQYTAIKPPGRNLIVNGDFATQFGREEFWNVTEGGDTVYVDTNRQYQLHMGDANAANSMYQEVREVLPGKPCYFQVDYVRPVLAGSVGPGGPPYAIAGVDYYDRHGNRLDSPSVPLQDLSDSASLSVGRVDFTVPADAVIGYAWVWVAGSGGAVDIPLMIDRIQLRQQGFSDLRLEAGRYTVSESAGSLQVNIIRAGEAVGPVSVAFDTIDESAVAGKDYQTRSGSVSWADGETGLRSVTIPIINDRQARTNRTFLFSIGSPSGQGHIVVPRTARVTIDDDETSNGDGDGLLGEYFDQSNFSNRKEVRVDATVDFDWGQGSPLPSIGPTTFSVRWTGKIEPRFSEKYTFRTGSDDGIRLWVDGQLLIDEWGPHAIRYHEAEIDLKAGVLYDIRIDYHELAGFAAASLSWSSASQSLEIVPASQLYPAEAPVELGDNLVTQTVFRDLEFPTSIRWTPDGQNMYIGCQDGRVFVARQGTLHPQPLLDLRREVNHVRDRGLLDIAVHPNFVRFPYIYLFFTYDPPEVFANTGLAGPDGRGNRPMRVVRFTLDAQNDYMTVVRGSENVLLGYNSRWEYFNAFVNSTTDFTEPPGGIRPDGTNIKDFLAGDCESHAAGGLAFGKDNTLFVSVPDGSSYKGVDSRAIRVQDLDNLCGKILRINPINGRGLPSNPYYTGISSENRSKVYQYGLRNPFRISVHPVNGLLFVGDVGWNTWEEINTGPAGANYGWPYFEGGDKVSRRQTGYARLPEATAFYDSRQPVTAPVHALSHSGTGINAIVLGDVYTGTTYPPEFVGDLFFNDLGQGIVRHVDIDSKGRVSNSKIFTTGSRWMVAIRQGPDGNLYFVNLREGIVGRWVFQ